MGGLCGKEQGRDEEEDGTYTEHSDFIGNGRVSCEYCFASLWDLCDVTDEKQ